MAPSAGRRDAAPQFGQRSMSRAFWLIFKTVLPAVALVWAVLIGIDTILVLAAEVDEIGIGNYNTGAVIVYCLLTLPPRAYGLFLYAAVVGAMVGLGQLAGRSELIALQASGMSRRRIAMAAILAVGALLLVAVGVGEYWGAEGDRRANALAATAKSSGIGMGAYSGLWLRDNDTVWNAQRVIADGNGTQTLWTVRLYRFENTRLLSLTEAETARYVDGAWQLDKVRRRTIHDDRVELEEMATLQQPSNVEPKVVRASAMRPRQLGIAELLDSLRFARANALDTMPFESALWYRISMPISALALVLSALPFAFASLRSGGLGRRVFIGMVLALSFFFLQRTLGNLFETYRWNMAVAFLLPPLLIGSWGLWRLRR